MNEWLAFGRPLIFTWCARDRQMESIGYTTGVMKCLHNVGVLWPYMETRMRKTLDALAWWRVKFPLRDMFFHPPPFHLQPRIQMQYCHWIIEDDWLEETKQVLFLLSIFRSWLASSCEPFNQTLTIEYIETEARKCVEVHFFRGN